MKTHIIEATNGIAYGKFMVGIFDTEWQRRPVIQNRTEGLSPTAVQGPIPGYWYRGPLLRQEGWGAEHILVVDLSSPGNGGIFRLGGMPANDIAERGLEVCWLFEAFLGWLYQQNLKELDRLPDLIHLEEVHE